MRKALLVLLILVAVGLVVADRFGVRVAQDEIGEQMAAQHSLRERPDVTIHGIPFLTQAVGGEYDHIDVKIGDWTDQGITVTDVRVDMRGVRAPLSDVASGDASNVTARTATASAIVPYEVIRKRAPREVRSIAPKGHDLAVELTGSVLGMPMAGSVVVSVKPTARGIAVTPLSVASAGAPQVPVASVRSRLTWLVPVADLPVGSRISEIEPTPGGLRVSATARNVRLNDLERAQPK